MKKFIFISIGLVGTIAAVFLILTFLSFGLNYLINGDYSNAIFSSIIIGALIKALNFLINDYHGE